MVGVISRGFAAAFQGEPHRRRNSTNPLIHRQRRQAARSCLVYAPLA